MKNQKGFSLVELIIVSSLLVVVMSASFSMLIFGNKVFKKSITEFDLQSAVRLTTTKTNQVIRYSSALFTVPETSFTPTSTLSSGWNYFGSMDGEVVEIKYHDNTFTKKVLLAKQDGMYYRVVFSKTSLVNEDNLLSYTLEVYQDGRVNEFGIPIPIRSVVTKLEALNALQVVDLKTETTTAIAYRSDERPRSVIGQVAMIMDNSGSMQNNMNGGTDGTSRMSILKTEAKKLIDGFSTEENITAALIPFGTTANNPKAFRSCFHGTSDYTQIVADINGMTFIGGTNTGDGIRRGYYKLKERTSSSTVYISNYTIILVDGVTTFATVESKSNPTTYFSGDGNIDGRYIGTASLSGIEYDDHGQIVGPGNAWDSFVGGYVTAMGANLKNGFSQVYVIGFSNVSSELVKVDDIATACGAPAANVFRANSSAQLAEALDKIKQEIMNDLWYLQGPKFIQ